MKFTKTNHEEQISDLVDRVNASKEDYDRFVKTWGKLTLGETWKKLGITEGKSTGGWPMLYVGDNKNGTVLCRNTISGLNALADLAKYQTLELHHHLAAFDPRLDVDNVKVDYDEEVSQYVFSHWRNFSFVRSAMSRPDYRDVWTKRNYTNKHQALDQFLRSKIFGTTFQVVMNRESELSHYQENIRPYMEKSFLEFLEAEKVRWQSADLNKKIRFNNQSSNSSIKLSDDRVALLQALAGATGVVVFHVITPTRSKPIEEKYDPSNTKQAEMMLNGIKNASPYVKFEIVK